MELLYHEREERMIGKRNENRMAKWKRWKSNKEKGKEIKTRKEKSIKERKKIFGPSSLTGHVLDVIK